MTEDQYAFSNLAAQITGIAAIAVAAFYFIRLYGKTHQFSLVRLFYVWLVAATASGPLIYFCAAKGYHGVGWPVATLVLGGLCTICSLGLGCDSNGGTLSRGLGRFLKCHERNAK